MASPSAKRPDATKANSTGAVVLLDLENVIGSNPRPEAVDKCLSAVLELAAPVAVCWAAYPQRLLSERAREVLKRHGVKTQWAKAGNNSADRALLKLARKEADKGRRRFVIVSGDADFAPLADLGTLEVIARHKQEIGSKLRRRASRIHHLPAPDSAARRAPASAVRSAEPAAEQRPGDVQRLPMPPHPRAGRSRGPGLVGGWDVLRRRHGHRRVGRPPRVARLIPSGSNDRAAALCNGGAVAGGRRCHQRDEVVDHGAGMVRRRSCP